MRRRNVGITLLLIVGLAGVPRCWNCWRQGVEDYDGAIFTLEGQLVVNVLDGFWHKATHQAYKLPELGQLRGRALSFAKPLYTISLVPGWWLRIPRTDIATLFSVFWALATIPIIYLIGRDLWGPREGLFAAAAYGASGFAAFYARLGAAESFGFFCLAIALWQYMRLYEGPKIAAAPGEAPSQVAATPAEGRKSRWTKIGFRRGIALPVFVGFLWGLAILANYRLLLTAAVVLSVCELLAAVRQGPRTLFRSALIAAGLFGMLVATELGFRIAVHAWRTMGGDFHAQTYWQQLQFFLFEHRPVGERFRVNLSSNLSDFAHYWWWAEGPALPLLGAAGMLLAWIGPGRRLRSDSVLALATVVTAAIWSVQHFTVPRVMAVLAIFLALFAGLAVNRLANRLRFFDPAAGRAMPSIAALGVLYCLLLGTMVYRIGPVWFSRESGFRQVAQTVAAAGDAPLYAFWRQKPETELYVVDRPVHQINETPGAGEFSPTHMPDSGLLVAESDYVAQHYPNAKILGHWPTRLNSSALELADNTWSWRSALERSEAGIELVVARLHGPAR